MKSALQRWKMWWAAFRRPPYSAPSFSKALPEAGYRLPVVLCCGDDAEGWPQGEFVRLVPQGCWIRITASSELQHVLRQLLQCRPGWGGQIAVCISVNPQQHTQQSALENQLHELRWQIGVLRRETRQALPLLITIRVAGNVTLTATPLWQVMTSEAGTQIWYQGQAPQSIEQWLAKADSTVLQQQMLFNAVERGFSQQVRQIFTAQHPDVDAVPPYAILSALQSALVQEQPDSLWRQWLSRHTALQLVAGWSANQDEYAQPDFLLPLLPRGQGFTPFRRALPVVLTGLFVSAIIAMSCSAWHNQSLIRRIAFDLASYQAIAMTEAAPKAAAVAVLREDAAQLNHWARQGAPLYLGLGLYRGERLHLPVLNAIRSWQPPPLHPLQPEPQPTIAQLDSLALFDSGKAVLKPGSTKVLINALIGIRARPGWLIVISGHTDNTGDPGFNQQLSLKRAEAVRNWMRDTGAIAESCFAVQGYGVSRPLATNDTSEGRATNRRVEIHLVPQADACQVPDDTLLSSRDGDGNQHLTE
ncbi:Outer membrane protein [Pantoea sp. AS-PWVM4]|uniref:OmpA family protein n=1 Tax=Pantoea sp. AS-PWVM4 TaxID=1332069 RepID=UPI0003AC929A|nr:OmpA family protein [Pantoea sp. AS-PWVM4]ERK17338.1 Outer membrane protein [Pantoea sp. AS-PWVM4]